LVSKTFADNSRGREMLKPHKGSFVMSGNRRFLLDTNAIVSLLAGNSHLADLLESAEYVGISIVSYLEFLAFP